MVADDGRDDAPVDRDDRLASQIAGLPRTADLFAFAGGYLTVWAATGIAAFPLAVLAGRIADRTAPIAADVAVTLCAIGTLYQLSPPKRRCLTRCRQTRIGGSDAPRNLLSAVRQGITHGGWCLACTWASTLLLFAFGLMNVAAMTAVAIIIHLEKHRSHGTGPSQLAAAAALACAIIVLVHLPLAAGLHHVPMTTMN